MICFLFERKLELLSIESLLKQPGLGQAESRSQELGLSLKHGGEGPKRLSCSLLPSRCTFQKVGLESRAGPQPRPCVCGKQGWPSAPALCVRDAGIPSHVFTLAPLFAPTHEVRYEIFCQWRLGMVVQNYRIWNSSDFRFWIKISILMFEKIYSRI